MKRSCIFCSAVPSAEPGRPPVMKFMKTAKMRNKPSTRPSTMPYNARPKPPRGLAMRILPRGLKADLGNCRPDYYEFGSPSTIILDSFGFFCVGGLLQPDH